LKIKNDSKDGVKSFFKKFPAFPGLVLKKIIILISKTPLASRKLLKLVKKNNDKLSQFKENLADLKVKKSSGFPEHFLVWARDHAKHVSILIVASVVLLGNLLSIEPKILPSQEQPQISSDIIAEAPTATTDIAALVKDIGFYTPEIYEDAASTAKKITTEVKLATVGESFLVKPNILGIRVARAAGSLNSGSWYQVYIVRGGESLGSIAGRFGISTRTLLTANNISDADLITPGQHLRIPQKEGVMHIVSRGENLISIVRYYHGDLAQTVRINNLKSDQDRTIYAGQKIFVVNGKKPAPTHFASATGYSSSSSGSSYSRPYYGSSSRFPYGYCTWYVASRRSVPWHGNANQWLWNARAYGYSTGRTPQVGAIMVTNESWWGHVAYVEAVHGNSVTISEMNYVAWGRVNYRTVSAWYGQYIY
jgi:surface antigen